MSRCTSPFARKVGLVLGLFLPGRAARTISTFGRRSAALLKVMTVNCTIRGLSMKLPSYNHCLLSMLALIVLVAGFVGWRTQAKSHPRSDEKKSISTLRSAVRLNSVGGGISCSSVVDDGVNLCLPAGVTYTLDGDLCYPGGIMIAGTLQVAPQNGQTGGSLVLRSPSIEITSTGFISADAAGRVGGSAGSFLYQGGTGGQQGAGAGCAGGPGNSVGQGGSGGGYGGNGGTPDNQWANGNPCDRCNNPTVGHCEGMPGVA